MARLDGLVWQLSATLRRIRLLADPALGAQAVELLIGEHRGRPYLFDATGGFPRAVPLWASLSMPLELWPSAPPQRTPAGADPRTAVLQVVQEAGGDTDAEPEQALCVLAGLPQVALTLQAARTALKVADLVLADPAHASLADGGGWAGNRRRDSDLVGIAHGNEPTLAPGAEQLVDSFEEADMLGMLVLSEDRILDDYVLPTGEMEVDPAIHGRDALAGLIDWVLAAATRPDPWVWSRDLNEEVWHAREPLNGPLDGQILLAASPGSYAVHVECPELYEEESEYAPSAAAAILLAEHAAIGAAAALRYRRDGKCRLVLPEQVSPTVRPTVTELIASAHEHQVLDFLDLAAALTHLCFRVHGTTTGARGGYWCCESDDPDGPDYINSLMGYVTDFCGSPATDNGEPANTSTVDSPVYLRHLARHRAALDPFVACYLAAAEGADGDLDFSQRHRIGALALKSADLTELARLDPRPVPEHRLDFVASIPLEVAALASWFDAYGQA